MTKPPIYRVFGKAGTCNVVIQVRHHETRELIDPCELSGFWALVKIKTPWSFDIRAGSKLFLTADTSKFMMAAGSLAPIDEPPLIPWRDREAAAQGKLSQG